MSYFSVGGDLTGTVPNPTIAKIQGVTVSAATPSSGQVLSYNGSNWVPANASGGVPSIKANAGTAETGAITLANGTNVSIVDSPAGTFTFNVTTSTVTNSTANTTYFPTFVASSATGNQSIDVSPNYTVNASTGALGTGTYVAIGPVLSVPTGVGVGSIAIGGGSSAPSSTSIGIGASASAGGSTSIAIGPNSVTTSGVSLGSLANSGTNSISIGISSAAPGSDQTAIGCSTQIAIGASGSTAVGRQVIVSSGNATAMGYFSTVSGNSVGFGANTAVTLGGSAFGYAASTNGGVAIGNNASTGAATDNVIIGPNSGNTLSTGLQNIGMGTNVLNGNFSQSGITAVGYQALQYSNSAGNTAFGYLSLNLAGKAIYNTGTAAITVAGTLTGTSTVWRSNMVGGLLVFANGVQAPITAFGNIFSMSTSYPSTVTSQTYAIYYGNNANAGTVAQSGSTVTGTSTAFTANMVGGYLIYATAQTFTVVQIIGYGNTTSITVNQSQTVTAGTAYTLYYQDPNTCTAFGYQTLANNVAGLSNTAVGWQALTNNIYGGQNTAVGNSCMPFNVSGGNNTAMGTNCLWLSYSGSANNAFGTSAAENNSTGGSNCAFGSGALFQNSSGSYNVAIGNSALTNSTASNLTAVGYQALWSNSTGTGNTGVGYQCLFSNTTSTNNTAMGYNSVNTAFGAPGSNNTTVGYATLGSLVFFGSNNSVLGVSNVSSGGSTSGGTITGNTVLTLNSAVVGSFGIGMLISGSGVTAGTQITALTSGTLGASGSTYTITSSTNTGGPVTMQFGASTNNSVIMGYQAGLGLSENNTVAIGYQSMVGISSGGNNTAVGYQTLQSSTLGAQNTVMGSGAGGNITTGSNNVCIGYLAGTDAVQNITTASNRVVVGNNSTTNAYIKVAWTVTSDSRDKTQVQPLDRGLEFVQKLNPVRYRMKESRNSDVPIGPVRPGFLAQEILQMEQGDNLIVDDEDVTNLKLRETYFIPILVRAIQELSAKNDVLERKIAELMKK